IGIAQGNKPATAFKKVPDLAKALSALVAAGCTIAEEPHPVGGTRSIAVAKDPAGNLLGLMHDA
ncbi:MAG TPA: VOC family protein, partial [Kofleriaceae bacterium]